MADATTVGTIKYDLNLDDSQFQSKLTSVPAAAATMGSQMSGSVDKAVGKIGASLGRIGRLMTVGFTLPIVGAMAVGVKAATDFNQSMTLLETQAGASAQEVQNLSQSVLAMAGQVGQTPKALADALYPIESAGYRGAQALDLLTQAAKLADIGQADLTATTNGLVSMMQSGIKGINNATDAVAYMNAIVGAGRMHMDDLNAAISTGFLATAGAFGLDIRSVGAALDYMTNSGVPAVDAATKLKMAMSLMAAPTKAAAKIMGDAGISITDVKAATQAETEALAKAGVSHSQLADDLKKPNGIVVAMQDLQTGFAKSGISAADSANIISRAFGGGRTGTSIEMLYQNTTKVTGAYEQLGKTTNNFASEWAAQQDTAKQHEADFQATLSVLSVTLANNILPYVDKFMAGITKLADAFGKLSPEQQKVILAVAAIIAIIGPLLVILSTAVTVFTNLKILITSVQVAFAGLTWASILWVAAIIAVIFIAYEVITHWTQVKDFFNGLWTFLKQMWADIPNLVNDAANSLMSVISNLIKNIISVLSGVKTAISKPFTDGFDVIKSAVSTVSDALSHLNPFARHSPSLIDNVQAGTKVIIDQYKKLFGSINGLSANVNLPMGAGAGITSAVLAGSGASAPTNVTIQAGAFMGSQADARAFAEMITRYQNRYQSLQGI